MKQKYGPGNLCWLMLTALIGVVGCSPDEICFTDSITLVDIAFKKELFVGTDSAEVQNDTLIFTSIKALGTDSVFIEEDTLTRVSIPVNTGSDLTIFIFDSNLGLDTLEVRYRRMQRLISVDCGPEQVIDNLDLIRTSFDSVVVVSPFLNEQINTNVEVFR